MEDNSTMCRQRTGTLWPLGRLPAAERNCRAHLIGGLLLVVGSMALLSIASVLVLSWVRACAGGESCSWQSGLGYYWCN